MHVSPPNGTVLVKSLSLVIGKVGKRTESPSFSPSWLSELVVAKEPCEPQSPHLLNGDSGLALLLILPTLQSYGPSTGEFCVVEGTLSL